MLVIYLQKLTRFAQTHANARKHLEVWKTTVENATWKKGHDVKATFPKAKMLKNNRARFEIVHNTYRIVAEIDYLEGIVEIRFIGTHNEYDAIDPETI